MPQRRFLWRRAGWAEWTNRRALLPGALIGLTIAALPCAAAAQPSRADDFYRGRTLSMVIGYTAGGAYDLYARVLARHIGRYIPGNPTIVPQNMAGAGSLRAANYIHSVAAKDGSVIGTFGRSVAVEPLIGSAQFDGRSFAWLGSIATNVSVCATWHTSVVKRWPDVFVHPFTLGGEGPGSDPDTFAILLKTVFGAKARLVTGYPGGNEVNLAMERGEVDGRCGWSWDSIKSTRSDWLRDRKLNLLAVFALERAPDIGADVPLVSDLAPNDTMRRVLRVHLAGQQLGRPFVAPPGIPEQRRAALRAAFDATMRDPEFVAEATRLRLEVNPTTGAEIDRLLAELYATPKDVLDQARQAMQGR
jgi:tripartite-type tricarboxylate transporter receptor subunit TctC